MEILGAITYGLYKDLETLKKMQLLEGREALVAQAQMVAKDLDIKPTSEKHRMFLELLEALGIGRIIADSSNDDFKTLMERIYSSEETTSNGT